MATIDGQSFMKASEHRFEGKKPSIPVEIRQNWQRIVDLIAELAEVPASLVIKTRAPKHSVYLSNKSDAHPYKEDLTFTLSDKLYCDSVIKHGELVVEDARMDPRWADNDDLEHGMSFYVGYPLRWPDHSTFGTICVLDQRLNRRALRFQRTLEEFARVIEADLSLLVEIEHRKSLEQSLKETLEDTEKRVLDRTQDLEESNAALKILLRNVEKAREEYDQRFVAQIKGMVMPALTKLHARVDNDPTAKSYIQIVEENLAAISVDMSGQLLSVFEQLTPSEQDVAQLIIQGHSTKNIARILSRGYSTIEFHRNNIRDKMGLRKSGKNLRTELMIRRD